MSDQIQVSRKPRYTIIDNPIFYDRRVGKHELLVYLVLAKYANVDAKSWPSAATIAELARLSRSTVFLALDTLEGIGYLKRFSGAKTQAKNGYFLVDQYEIEGIEEGSSVVRATDGGSQQDGRGSPCGGLGVVRATDGGSPQDGRNKLQIQNTNTQKGASEAEQPVSQSWATPEGELVGRFFREFHRVTGGWTTGPMGNELAQARDIIARMGAEKAMKALEAYFAGDWWFTWNKAKTKRVWTWGSFVKNLEEIACELADPVAEKQPLAIIKPKAEKCPACGKTWDPIYDICVHCGREKEHPHAL